MALWQAAKLSAGVVGFEPRTPGTVAAPSRRCPAVPFLWRELESGSGQEILTQCGGLSIGDRRGGYIDAILRNVREMGALHTVLDAAALRARYPQHRHVPAAPRKALTANALSLAHRQGPGRPNRARSLEEGAGKWRAVW
jgi:hypothetical protein